MKTIRNLVVALCTSVTMGGISSCDIDTDQVTVIDLSEATSSLSVSGWYFINGECEIEMIVGDSIDLPSTIKEKDSCSWISNNPTVANVTTENTVQRLKAISVGNAVVSDEKSNYKINVTVKDKN